jgi:tripeptidyl-peptidase-2
MKTSILPLVVSSLVLLVPRGAALSLEKPAPAAKADSPSNALPLSPFPTAGILPKEEIGATRFLVKNPQHDGRGVVVAIFDSGVDPGAAGLERTTDDRPKVIDLIDGTGSGDVDTSATREAKEGRLEGLSGRPLKLPAAWLRPGRKFHVGMKRAYDFFPHELVARLKRERRTAFEKVQREVEAALRRRLAEADGQIAPSSAKGAEAKPRRDELEARLRALLAADRQYDDPGPIYDCIVFHDGRAWQAAVDTDEDGDLADEKLLTDYRDCLQYGTFGHNSQLNFAVNIYDDARTLSLVACSDAHATHVAGIVAGHFPKQPELNGVAPGAQIVSVKIGDSRLGGMETGAGLIRGLTCVVRNKCDLVNMSYGEPTSRPNGGRLLELLSELVDRHGVIFVSSAGNAGPALSTVGAPGGTASSLLGIGAYVSPAMMQVEYTLRRKLPDMPYTWTSRGPTYDGDFGVDLFAPGGAISSVPAWMLQRQMLMNGTSMASPNCCGAIALVLSALKARQVPYSPYSVRRALENTAQPIAGGDPYSQGAGLIQIDRACQHAIEHAGATGERLRIDIDVTDRDHARGIYLRDAHETCRPLTATVQVKPVFREEAEAKEKLDFELRVALRTTQPWAEAGQYLVLAHAGRPLEVRVDPTRLSPGLHTAEVRGYDAAAPQRGPLFRLPITVTKPEAVPDGGELHGKADCRHGDIVRRFVAVPPSATRMDLRLRLAGDGPRKFFLHTLQRREGMWFRDSERREPLALQPGVELARSLAVAPGTTLEFCLAPLWSTIEERTTVEYDLSFRGLVPDCRELTLTADEPSARIEVTTSLRREMVSPAARLETHRTFVAPSQAVIRPLDPRRDRRPDGRDEFELTLSYPFDQAETGTVTPRFPGNDNLLYDSDLGTHVWLLFDGGKRRVAAGDVFPKGVRLMKGPHSLRLQLRHSDVARLEGLKATPLVLDRPLASAISVEVYRTRTAALAGGPAFGGQLIDVGQRAAIYVKPPAAGQLPSAAQPGDVLLGTIDYGKADAERPGSGERPGGFTLRFVVPPRGKPADKAATPAAPKDLWEFKLAQLQALPDPTSKEFDALFQELLKDRRDDLPVLVVRLHRLDTEAERENRLDRIVAAAEAVVAHIDAGKLAAHFGSRVDADDPKAVAERAKMTAQRDTLVDALYRKGRALGYMDLPEVREKRPIKDKAAHDKAFEDTFAELRRWVDTTEAGHYLLHARRERRIGRPGRALEALNKHLAWHPLHPEQAAKRGELYEELGWKHWAAYERQWQIVRFPPEYERP